MGLQSSKRSVDECFGRLTVGSEPLSRCISVLTDTPLDADKVQSIYQGRPVRLRNAECSVPMSFLDEYEELELFDSLTYSATPRRTNTPTRSVSINAVMCKLSILAEVVIETFYAEESSLKDSQALLETAASLKADLELWRSSLPIHLDLRWNDLGAFDILPHSLSLMYAETHTAKESITNIKTRAMYHSLTILLFRPFVSEGHLQALSNTYTTSAFAECAGAATEIDAVLRLYKQHFCLKTCPYFISYATYASGTIHARIAAQKLSGSHPQKMLRHCLEVLSEQQKECHAPRQSMKTLLMLARRLGVDVGTGLRAEKSRMEDGDNDQTPAPYTRMLDGVAGDSSIGPPGFGAGLQDFDIAAITGSFVFDPSDQVGIIGEGQGRLPVMNDAGAQNAGPCRDTSSTWDTSDFDFDEFLAANMNDDGQFFDPLFGFDAATL
jgi:hypothetical protein